jgi:hypothetical protein
VSVILKNRNHLLRIIRIDCNRRLGKAAHYRRQRKYFRARSLRQSLAAQRRAKADEQSQASQES